MLLLLLLLLLSLRDLLLRFRRHCLRARMANARGLSLSLSFEEEEACAFWRLTLGGSQQPMGGFNLGCARTSA